MRETTFETLIKFKIFKFVKLLVGKLDLKKVVWVWFLFCFVFGCL